MTKTTPAKFLPLFFALFVVSVTAFGQKVKYKDLFALLSTKQYEQAEPFLKRYLADNDDNPNAFLFRAIIFNERAGKIDVLKQRDVTLALMDSALIFFDRARATIDDREIRRNKEYYQIYSRRDLRTGEFGVKLSDIQFDIDKKMEALRERIASVKATSRFFDLTDSLYRGSQALYASLRERYASERALYLRADEQTMADLKALSARFDSCRRAFESYDKARQGVSNFSYRQEFAPVEIKAFETEGLSTADLFAAAPTIWDYKRFADNALSVIQDDIVPMRNHLVSYDVEINKLREKLLTDSVSVRSDLTRIIDGLLQDQLKRFDPDPLPLDVFNAKIADLEYRSVVLEHAPLRDSADATFQHNLAAEEMRYINRLDSILDGMAGPDLDERIANYAHFVDNAYGNATVLSSFVSTLASYAEREKDACEARLAATAASLNWILDGLDSIPLTSPVDGNSYKMLLTSDEQFTTGLHFTDSLHATGYFYTVIPSRRPDVKVEFPVARSGFRESRLSSTRALVSADPGGQIYFVMIYSETPEAARYNATLAKIYRSDGLSWSNPFSFGFLPSELVVTPDTGDITVRGASAEALIDKNGKMVK